MDIGQLYGRGMSFPPHVGADGRIAWSQGEANIRESIYVILMTQFRERISQPDFGGNLGLFLFEPNTVTTRHLIETQITRALTRWEPRIAVESVRVEPGDQDSDVRDPQTVVATISYKLVATQTREQVSISVTLGA